MIPTGNVPAPGPSGSSRGLVIAIASFMLLVIAGGAVYAFARGTPRSQAGLPVSVSPSTPTPTTGPPTPTSAPPTATPVSTDTPPATATETPSSVTTPSPTTVQAPSPTVAPAPTPTAVPQPTTVAGLTAAKAQQVVLNYYADINAKDYAAAYALLSPALQAQQSLSSFAAGFAQTAQDRLTVTGVSAGSAGTYAVAVTLAAQQSDGSVKNFHGSYTVGLAGGAPKIVSARMAAG